MTFNPAMLPPRDVLVAGARDAIALGSKSFAAASRLFDRETREHVWLLYAWCRACDDIADGQDHGGALGVVADPDARLARIEAGTDAAFRGQATGDLPLDALAQLIAERPVPRRLADDLVEGFRLDLTGWRPGNEDDLLRYCYHVAGAVGGMMAAVMGVDPEDYDTLDRACDLGLAFQLANIARDVGEDAAGGRCYLPLDWLADAGIDPAHVMDPAHRPALVAMVRRLTDLAELHEASARIGAGRLSRRCRWAVLSAAGIYGGIAREVAARGPDAWDQRVYTSRAQKLGHVARAGLASLGPAPVSVPRTGLWTRPR